MSDRADQSLQALVNRAEAGDPGAKDALFHALYAELHSLAEALLRRRGGTLTLGTTSLLHEAYLRIVKRESLAFPDQYRFLGYASRAMRGLIIDYVRNHRAQKRGGELTFVELDEGSVAAESTESDSLAQLDLALEELSRLEPALAELVDLKFFCGFSFAEIAAIRGVSDRTIQRDWAKARILLHRSLSDAQEG